jgi:DNA polymerase III subunit chi
MPEINIYILKTDSLQERYRFACKLIEQVYHRQGIFCYIQTNSPQQSHTIDELLWSFRPKSFVPHEIYHDEMPKTLDRVLISHQPAPKLWQQIIVNLSDEFPAPLRWAGKIIEITDNVEQHKILVRERCKYYQKLAIKPHYHLL